MPLFKQKSTMALATLAMTLAVTAAAQAGDAARPGVARTQVVVNYSDLNLDSVTGNRTLYARLSNAARRACGPEPDHRDLGGRSDFRKCRTEALAAAVDRVGSPELQALHARRSVKSVG